MTAAQLGQRLDGISPRSARRYWAEQRHQYEAVSTTKSAPWKQDGISRTSWYRRRKRGRHEARTKEDDDDDHGHNARAHRIGSLDER